VQTLVAFAFADAGVRPERIRAGLQRVEQWYAPLWGTQPRAHQRTHSGLGLALWEDPAEQCRWPAWTERAERTVATLHVPLGHERLTDQAGPGFDLAPLALVEHLRRRPEEVRQLPPPFVLAELDSAAVELTLLTDGLGLGRLHEVRTPEGSFWSNRPVGALRFAGLRAEADGEAWQRMAACDWAMGDRTPYRGVSVVPAATRITADAGGVRRTSLDVLCELVRHRRDPLTPASVERTAAALTEVASSVSAAWPGVPVLSLSGGRDSRLVVAAFVAAGRPFRLRTYDDAAGEAATARRLVDLLPSPVEHEVTTPAAQQPGRRRAGAYARARRWHDVAEGLRPSIYLRSNAPRRLLHHTPPLIAGIGGEFGHAPGYPNDVEQLEQLPVERRLDAFSRALQARVTLPRGVAPHAMESAARQIRAVVDHAAERGVSDAKALDWFYSDERLRRWGMAGESAGRVLPLLVGEFLSAALGLSTAQSRASALHTALIERLVPQWAGTDYYSATLRQRQAVRQQRLWEEKDVDLLAEIVQQPDDWGAAFEIPRVQAIWRRARAGKAAPRDELLLQRVVWRAAFTEHLAAVNAEPALVRERVVLTTPPAAAPAQQPATALAPRGKAVPKPAPARRQSPVLALATWANDVPLARRLARTALGRRIRRFLGA